MWKINFPEGSKVRVYHDNEKACSGYSDEFLIKGPRPSEIVSIYPEDGFESELLMDLVGGSTVQMNMRWGEGPRYDPDGSLVDEEHLISCTIEEYCEAFFKREDSEELFNGFWSGQYYHCFHIDTSYCKIASGTSGAGGFVLRNPKDKS
tara:strand:+ start:72 stop:518 length:447 start_codon:yes stop_codon:yes gene_type:complete